MTKIFFLILSLNLSQCFIAPRFKIYRALKKAHCTQLSSALLFKLSKKDLKQGISICVQDKQYKSAIILLDYLETLEIPLEEKLQIWRQKGEIYKDKLFKYPQAVLEHEKFLKHHPNNNQVLLSLIEAQIKTQAYLKALQNTKILLSKNLNKNVVLKVKFIRARLLLLLKHKEEASQLFDEIKKNHPRFYAQNQGGYYKALLLEKDQKFLQALEELKSMDSSFLESKKRHLEFREKNTP